MNTVKSFAVLFFVVVILTGTGGFNVFYKYCSTTNSYLNYQFSVESDISKNPDAICLAEKEKPGQSCCLELSVKNKTEDNCKHAENCCSTKHFFLKTDVFNFKAFSGISFEFLIAFSVKLESNFTEISSGFISELNSFHNFSPPLFGKQLLFAIHQLKLPSFTC